MSKNTIKIDGEKLRSLLGNTTGKTLTESAIESFVEDLKKVKENPFLTEAEVEAKIKSEKDRLKKAMEAASVKSWTTPRGYKITLIPDGEDKTIEEDTIDLEALKRDLPELFKDKSDGGYMERVQIIKKGCSGYVKITEPKKKEV